jgi:putative FmdB family regulatory protein
MPTYEYRCPDGHEFERFQKISDPVRVRCPECGRMASRIISGGAGLIFKGSGFYITDYGKDGKGPPKQETEAKKETTAGGSETPNPEKTAPADQSEKPAKKSGKKKAAP